MLLSETQPGSVPAVLLSQPLMNSKLIFLGFAAHSRFCLAGGAEYVLSLTFPLSFRHLSIAPAYICSGISFNQLM